MSRKMKIIALLLTCMSVCILSMPAHSHAARARNTQPPPELRSVYAEQAGDSRVFLYFEGNLLPRPEILFQNEEFLMLLLSFFQMKNLY